MTFATTLNGAAPAPARTPRLLGLYLLLILIAAIEAFDGLSHVPTLFGDMSEIPGPGIGGAIIKAYIAVHPLLALAALALATIGRLRCAIMALGALVLMNWLNDMPSVVRHGLDFKGLSAFETPTCFRRAQVKCEGDGACTRRLDVALEFQAVLRREAALVSLACLFV